MGNRKNRVVLSEVENNHLHLEDSGSAEGSPTLADKDPRFLGSPDARALRILAEYLEPSSRLRRCGIHSTVVFFGSARILPKKEAQAQLRDVKRCISNTSTKGKAALKAKLKAAQRALEMSRYYEDARTLSRRLTRWSRSLNTVRATCFIQASLGCTVIPPISTFLVARWMKNST